MHRQCGAVRSSGEVVFTCSLLTCLSAQFTVVAVTVSNVQIFTPLVF